VTEGSRLPAGVGSLAQSVVGGGLVGSFMQLAPELGNTQIKEKRAWIQLGSHSVNSVNDWFA